MEVDVGHEKHEPPERQQEEHNKVRCSVKKGDGLREFRLWFGQQVGGHAAKLATEIFEVAEEREPGVPKLQRLKEEVQRRVYQKKDMARGIMASCPCSLELPARIGCNGAGLEALAVARWAEEFVFKSTREVAKKLLLRYLLTLAASPHKYFVHDGESETPLGEQNPPKRHNGILN